MVKILLAKAITDPAFFVEIRNDFQYLNKTNIQQNIFVVLTNYFNKYQKMPINGTELSFVLQETVSEKELVFIEKYNESIQEVYNLIGAAKDIESRTLLDKVKDESLRQQISTNIIQTVDTFSKTSTEDLLKKLRDLVFKCEEDQNKENDFYFNDIGPNMEKCRYSPNSKIPTRIKELDACLYGGLSRKEITTFMAPSGRGKSVLLANINHGMTTGGHNTWYITLETSAEATMVRTYRRAMLKNKDYMREEKNESEIVDCLGKFYACCGAEAKLTYREANTYAVEDLRAELAKMKMQGGFFPECIIIDHLDLLTTHDKNLQRKGEATYWRYIVDALRAIAMEYDIAIATATQTNRGSINKDIITADDIGDSYGKVQSCDVLISINQTEEEKLNYRMRLYTAKNRDFVSGSIIELYCNLDYMCIMSLDEAYEIGILGTSEGPDLISNGFEPIENDVMAGVI